jgi:hypothetical protein
MCSDGTAYSFAFREGTGGLVVEFEGGGGCWNAKTCAKQTLPTKNGHLSYNSFVPQKLPAILNGKVNDADLSNSASMTSANAYATSLGNIPEAADWSMIFIPYCTGDAHSGNNTVDFGGDVGEVNFKGRANTQAVLSWAQERFKAHSSRHRCWF